MRNTVSLFLLIVLALAVQGCQKAEEENPVIARVNLTEIRRSQLQEAAQRRAIFLQQQGQPIPPDLSQQALQLIIQNELLYQEGSKLDIPELQTIIEQQFRDFIGRFPSEDIFRSSLQQANSTPEMVRENIRRTAIINYLIENQIGESITISPKDVKSYYKKNREEFRKPETVHARHILISLPPTATEEEELAADEKIADIKERLKEGESFEELALIYSDSPDSAQGGDMGPRPKGSLTPDLEAAVFSAKRGRVTGPVKTGSGLELILVESHERERLPKFKEVTKEIEDKLRRDKINQQTSAFLGEVASRSNIQILPQPPMR